MNLLTDLTVSVYKKKNSTTHDSYSDEGCTTLSVGS